MTKTCRVLLLMLVFLWPCNLAIAETIKPSGGRIVGGRIVEKISEFPWQAALMVDRRDGTYLCGGSFISSRWIVTAAHCLGVDGDRAKVRFKGGVLDYDKDGIWEDAEPFRHPAYNPGTQENDIALLRITALPPNASVISLAPESTAIPEGQPLEVSGWGATSEGAGGVDVLRAAAVNYVANDECNLGEAYGGRVKSAMMCAGYQGGKVDACQGDSGGPLIWRAGAATLVGVVSFGEGCARPNKYGIYTRVSQFRDWIRLVQKEAR